MHDPCHYLSINRVVLLLLIPCAVGWDLLVRSISVLHFPPLLHCCFFDAMLWLMISLSRWLGLGCICHWFLSHFSVLPGGEAGVCLDNPDLITDKFKFGLSQKYCSTFHMHKAIFFTEGSFKQSAFFVILPVKCNHCLSSCFQLCRKQTVYGCCLSPAERLVYTVSWL